MRHTAGTFLVPSGEGVERVVLDYRRRGLLVGAVHEIVLGRSSACVASCERLALSAEWVIQDGTAPRTVYDFREESGFVLRLLDDSDQPYFELDQDVYEAALRSRFVGMRVAGEVLDMGPLGLRVFVQAGRSRTGLELDGVTPVVFVQVTPGAVLTLQTRLNPGWRGGPVVFVRLTTQAETSLTGPPRRYYREGRRAYGLADREAVFEVAGSIVVRF
jgi:hypothetical protein